MRRSIHVRFVIKTNNTSSTQQDTLNPAKIAKKILGLLESQEKALTQQKLGESLEVPDHLLKVALDQLLLDQQVVLSRKQAYSLADQYQYFTGRVSQKREGHGVLKTPSGQEISISPRQMSQIWDGDEINVHLGHKTFYGKQEGILDAIIDRAHSRITGRYKTPGAILPDNPRLPKQIAITDHQHLKAKKDDYIAVDITKYPDETGPAEAKLVDNLGQANSPFVQTELAILRHGIPQHWSKTVQQQAKALKMPSDEDAQSRVDLRELPLMTIDGESARDFDDAVFASSKPRGGWRLWVAIADVSHYVPINSPLDVEALERGTSVYFPHRVVPMLPEQLSNELCSLKPNVDRLAMVCEMAISANGKISKFVFYEAIIRSHARLTYNQVGAFLAGTEHELHGYGKDSTKTITQDYPGLCEPLLDMYSLYQQLFKVRQQRGALEFGSTESEFQFDLEGHIQTVVPIYRNDAHRLIEEMMLAANVCAAKLLLEHEAPAVYRNHEPPSSERVKSLNAALQSFGAKAGFGDEPQPKDFLAFLDRIADRPDGHILQNLMLRSMSQAKYESECKGHFGLAYQAYTHFTSPIRRYPDLIVHRTIRYLIRNQKGTHLHREKGAKKLRKQDWLYIKASDLSEVASQNSSCERRADDATRDVTAWLKCSYMQDHIGEAFDGQVSGVTHFGLFVNIDELMIDGLVHISSLDKDYYNFNDQTQQLVGERSGFVYKTGDPLRVIVARVSLEDRKIDFTLAKNNQQSSSKTKSHTKSRTKGKAQSAEKPTEKNPAKTKSRSSRSRSTNSKER